MVWGHVYFDYVALISCSTYLKWISEKGLMVVFATVMYGSILNLTEVYLTNGECKGIYLYIFND